MDEKIFADEVALEDAKTDTEETVDSSSAKPPASEVRMPRTISPMGMFFGSGAKMPFEEGYDPRRDEPMEAMFATMSQRSIREKRTPQKPHTVRNIIAAVICVAVLYLITIIINL